MDFKGPLKNEVVLLDGGDVGNIRFEHCRIRFTNNAVRMRNVVFVGCVFEFPVSDDPNPYLKTAAEKVLASKDLEQVTMLSLG